MPFLYATVFINRLIRTAVGVRIMCCSVTDSEWLAVLAHRGGDLGMACTWRALCISAVHTSMHLITNLTEITPWRRILGSRPPQLSPDLRFPQTWPSNVIHRDFLQLSSPPGFLYEVTVVVSFVSPLTTKRHKTTSIRSKMTTNVVHVKSQNNFKETLNYYKKT